MSLRNWWILANSTFGVGIYVGMWNDVVWLGYLTSMLVWVMLCSYLMAFWTRNGPHRYRNPVHPLVGNLADYLFYAALVASGWIVTAAAYAETVQLIARGEIAGGLLADVDAVPTG